jgi:hypothetical protein
MFARAAEAFYSRSGGSSYYAEEGRRLDKLFKEANKQAAQSIFLTRRVHQFDGMTGCAHNSFSEQVMFDGQDCLRLGAQQARSQCGSG